VPIVGLDGGQGFPGYSGLWPNPMLANSLVLVRDLLTSGSVQTAQATPKDLPELPKWQQNSEKLLPKGSDQTLLRLQPNVRAALAEMELLQHLTFDRDQEGTDSVRRQASMSQSTNAKIVTLAAPYRDEFVQQLEQVFAFADLRAERSGEILSQVVPQTAYWSAIAALTPERHRYTLELLGIGLRFAMMVVMRFKLMLNCPRPGEYTPLVQPMVLTPGYSAYPSGHATEAYFAAELLAALHEVANNIAGVDPAKPVASSLRGQLKRLAYRVAENRVVAGLHFPVDSLAGQLLGGAMARYFIWSCTVGSGPKDFWSGAKLPNTATDLGKGAQPCLDTDEKAYLSPGEGKPQPGERRPVLSMLWTKSIGECTNAS